MPSVGVGVVGHTLVSSASWAVSTSIVCPDCVGLVGMCDFPMLLMFLP
jgi:hypothetical protein